MLMLRRNAYIMVAVHGSGYCTSAFHAAKLILNNILRIAAVNVVGDALLWLGKVCCCIRLPSVQEAPSAHCAFDVQSCHIIRTNDAEYCCLIVTLIPHTAPAFVKTDA